VQRVVTRKQKATDSVGWGWVMMECVKKVLEGGRNLTC